MNDDDDEMGFDLFGDETYESPVTFRGGISPDELSKLVLGSEEDLLEGLYSSFFLSRETSDTITDSNRETQFKDFLDNLNRPYSEKVSPWSVASFLNSPLDLIESKSRISKCLSSGICLEGGKFNRDTENSDKVAEQILACYPGIQKVFSGNNGELFPVGHRAETSFLISWPNAFGVLTFLGWD